MRNDLCTVSLVDKITRGKGGGGGGGGVTQIIQSLYFDSLR